MVSYHITIWCHNAEDHDVILLSALFLGLNTLFR